MVMRSDNVCIASLTDVHIPVNGFVGIESVGAPTRTANARLIAAAPDLLAIAREYADSCLDCSGSGTVQRYDTDDSDCAVTEFVDCPECAHVRAVIAAVEGA